MTDNTEITPSLTVEPLAVGVKGACELLGIGRRLLWILTNTNEIPHVRLGRRIIYPVADLRTWLSDRARGGRR
ncbi:MAG TPA: helix-turn-helix domain-containing protein [Phycisphaerae bacterium]|nr:helix-turn-helix domain-containing protein [Phycisphaerae bacterium]HRY66849.1 helix-turn-helix domain-containing protein [Phycisphaerae bacterium]HSA26907.1 helix-turn-helix domain-containing protein [Phycisphaerae bacterium]